MLLRGGRRVGGTPKCQCGEFYVNPDMEELCSRCHNEVFPDQMHPPRTPTEAWMQIREDVARQHFIPEEAFNELLRMWPTAAKPLLFSICVDFREKGKYLSWSQFLRLWEVPSRIEEEARIHLFCPFVFDRWNIEAETVPDYAMCYYGETYPSHGLEDHIKLLKNPGISEQRYLFGT